jgi:hypothetical protein
MIAMNKRLLISQSRDDSNRCTPCRGKPDQHDTYASHTCQCTPSVHFLRAVPVYGNLSWVTDKDGQSHCPREKGLPTQSTACRMTDPRVCTQFLSRANQWSSGDSQTSIDSKLLGLPGPYHQYAIGTFDTCSRVPIPSVRNWHMWRLPHRNLGIATTLTPPFPSSVPLVPLNSPARSHFYPTLLSNNSECLSTYDRQVVFRPLGVYQ